MFKPIFVSDKHTRELRMNENPMSKKLTFLCFNKKLEKAGEKQSTMSLSM